MLEIAEITVKLRYFSIFKELFKKEETKISLPSGSTVIQLESLIRKELPDSIKELPFRIAVNKEFSKPLDMLKNDDEIALIPPTQGG